MIPVPVMPSLRRIRKLELCIGDSAMQLKIEPWDEKVSLLKLGGNAK